MSHLSRLFDSVTENAAFAVDPAAIQVVVGCDDGYARHLAVMLLSLFAHSRKFPAHVHVMIPPDFASREKLDRAMGRHVGNLTYHVLADEVVRGLKQRDDLTAATYYRLLMSQVLPSELRRVIYLDCDMMLRDDLAELWQMSLGDMIIAAVPDPGFVQRDVLGLLHDAPYFNAGVLLIDLARWRTDGIGEAALEFAAAHPERLTFNDQCALNWILRGRWLQIEPVWNLQTAYVSRIVNGELKYMKPIPQVGETARVVHFNAPGRPWLYMDRHPFKHEYLKYMAGTPWRAERPSDRYPHNMIIKALEDHAPVLLPVYRRLRKFI